MKKLLLSSVALLGFTAGAMAADLPRRAAPPDLRARPGLHLDRLLCRCERRLRLEQQRRQDLHRLLRRRCRYRSTQLQAERLLLR